jgi:C1A family cysteine protease
MKKKTRFFLIAIIIIFLITPTLKGLKLDKKNYDDYKISKEKDHYFGLLKGGRMLPEGKEIFGLAPSSWDWRNHEGFDWTTSIKDQGSCGSCYAFGLYSAMESCIKIKSNKPNFYIDLSEQYMVSCGTDWISGIFGCEGAYLSSILDFVEQFGAITESCFPYISGTGNLPPCMNKCQEWQESIIEINGWNPISPSPSSLKNALVNYGPLITGIEVYENFLTYTEGIYEPHGEFLGYHLVSIVGYNDNPGYWICKNSWGIEWGEEGWFKIKYDECELEKDTVFIEVYNNTGLFNEIKCGTDTYKRSGDIYNYNSCTISMSEHFWAGPASAWYRFNLNEGKVSEGMDIGIKFSDSSLFGNGPNLYLYNWNEKKYTKLGKNLGHWHDPKWVWIKTSDSNKYINNNGILEVLVTTEDEDLTLLCHVGLYGKIAMSDLKCYADLKLGKILPGQKVVNNIKVENVGDPNSELSWMIVGWPEWGDWNFSPFKGEGLKTNQGLKTIIVTITAPYIFDRFEGDIRIKNVNDVCDFEILRVSLTTPNYIIKNYT